jgi:hypothetical protein
MISGMNNDRIGALLAHDYAIGILVVWLLIAVAACIVAPDRRGTFFVMPLLFLGPLGLAAALIAQPREPRYIGPPATTLPRRQDDVFDLVRAETPPSAKHRSTASKSTKPAVD